MGPACERGRGPMEPAGARLRGPACKRGRGPMGPLERPALSGQWPDSEPWARLLWRLGAVGPRGSRAGPRFGDRV
eukprot:4948125-Alexandrium_andersonii.AAC.1